MVWSGYDGAYHAELIQLSLKPGESTIVNGVN